jgi:hypothetical protein
MVMRRWIPAVLALAIAFAPVALEACQIACAHGGETVAGGHVHHHHAPLAVLVVAASSPGHHHHQATQVATSQTAATATWSAGPQLCLHDDSLPVAGAAAGKLSIQAPATLPVVVEASYVVPTRLISADCAGPPPVPLALNLPLRL